MPRVFVCCVVALLVAACSPDKGFPSTEVGAEDYGEAWPLTVDTAVLTCGPGGVVTVTVKGRSYGIEEVRRPADAERGLRRIWAGDAEGRRSLQPLVEDARKLCD